MNVLSLFDGMSGGQISLTELGIKVDKYYASEIDKYATMQTQHNFPGTIQLGSVLDVDVIKLEPIDILIGGSPCQSFSFAGKRNGMTTTENEEIYTLERYLELKSEGFQFEGQSYLFWEYMRILTDIRKYNPDVKFLLENVEMGNKWERVLSEAIGVFGVHINSALVSAQNRKRIYWTNIRVKQVGLFGELHSDIPQPKDEGILLRDILENDVGEKYYLSEKLINFFHENTKKMKENGNGFAFKPTYGNKKGNAVTTKCGSRMDDDFICIAQRGRESACLSPKRTEYGKQIRKDYESGLVTEQRKNIQQLEPRDDGKTNTITTVQKDNLVMKLNKRQKTNLKDGNGKADAFLSTSWKGSQANGMTLVNKDYRIRRLTPTECARLQTVPSWYKWIVSETQQYRMLGNGWNINTIMHILKHLIKYDNK